MTYPVIPTVLIVQALGFSVPMSPSAIQTSVNWNPVFVVGQSFNNKPTTVSFLIATCANCNI